VLRCWRDVGGGSYGGVVVVAREIVGREGRVSGARDGGQRAHCARSTATPPPSKEPPPTARYCCAAPALARRQQSLRSIDKPLRSFVAAGQGSLSMKVRRGSRGGCGCSSLYRTLGVG